MLRRELPTTLWTDADPGGSRPAVARGGEPLASGSGEGVHAHDEPLDVAHSLNPALA